MRPPILHVHGACSQPAHMEPWRAFFAGAGYDCAAPALPGHVPSDPAILARATIRDYLAALREAQATLGRPPVVIGHSLGGMLAQHLARAAACAGVVLVSSMPAGSVPVTWPAFRDLIGLGPDVLRGRPFRPRAEALSRLALHDLSTAERDELLPDFVAESGRVYRQILLGGGRIPAGSLGCPVLVVHGEADRLVPLATARRLAQKYAGELTVIPAHGHWLVAGSLTTTVLPPVVDWIRRLGRSA